ncbi:MAG: hypothetical protein R2704_04280 [Microthrixaceae bacterium]
MQEALEVGADDLIIEVLRAMQAAGRHLAVVRAASSDVVGILTVEDIVEELVGSIGDPTGTERQARGPQDLSLGGLRHGFRVQSHPDREVSDLAAGGRPAVAREGYAARGMQWGDMQ